MKKIRIALWIVIILAFCSILILNFLKITNINLFFDGCWTLLIIVPCFVSLFSEGSKVGSIMGILTAVFILLCYGGLDTSFLWFVGLPIITLILASKIIYDNIKSKRKRKLDELKDDKAE